MNAGEAVLEPVAALQDSETKARLPGQPAMWFFVLGDLWIFTCYFACYGYDRSQSSDAFLLGQQSLSQGVGAINTLLLLTSSLFIALCVQAVRAGLLRQAKQFLLLGAGCGVVFLLVKIFEWGTKINTGLVPGSEHFFIYYFMFTGLHFLHVCLGLLFLILVYREIASSRQVKVEFVESGAIYWHMVDLLWIVIFALLYLLR